MVYNSTQKVHPYKILSLQMDFGKMNGPNDTTYARLIRHADVNMCAYRGLRFYLFARFNATNKLKYYDLTSNKSWFNIKSIVDSTQIASLLTVEDELVAEKKKI